jgi:hypothetical protein
LIGQVSDRALQDANPEGNGLQTEHLG